MPPRMRFPSRNGPASDLCAWFIKMREALQEKRPPFHGHRGPVVGHAAEPYRVASRTSKARAILMASYLTLVVGTLRRNDAKARIRCPPSLHPTGTRRRPEGRAVCGQPPAIPSFSNPHTPLGSAAVMAIPATMGLESNRVHSSGVKLDFCSHCEAPFEFRVADSDFARQQR